MWLIAGLGNPELKYRGTRHNAGFAVIDKFCEKYAVGLNESKFSGVYTKLRIGTEQIILLKPLTYMNESGRCIAPLAGFYRIPPEQVIVLSDDISLAPGRLRIRPRGSAGGHNGLKSVIACLGTEDFPRVRIGVGEKPERMDLAAYVLGKFDETDTKRMDEAYLEAVDACLAIVTQGVEDAMNRHNAAKSV